MLPSPKDLKQKLSRGRTGAWDSRKWRRPHGGGVSLLSSHSTDPTTLPGGERHARPISRTSAARGGGGTCPGHAEDSGPAELCTPDPLTLEPKVLPTTASHRGWPEGLPSQGAPRWPPSAHSFGPEPIAHCSSLSLHSGWVPGWTQEMDP